MRNRRPRGGSSTVTPQEDLLKHVFQELQDLGLVHPTRVLAPFKKEGPEGYPKFQAGILHRRRIYYWLDKSALDGDSLKFILLHEERHLKGHLSLAGYLLNAIGWFALVCYLLLTYHPQPPWGSLTLLAVPAVWYGSMPFLRTDETRSDLWAARQMKAKLGVVRPSEVALKAMTYPPLEMSRSQRVFKHILFDLLHADYHPPLKKRIARIVREVDNDQ